MKKELLKFCLFSLAFLLFACGSGETTEHSSAATEAPQEAPEETPAAEETPKVLISTDSYKTTILEAGIPSPRKEMQGKIGDIEITVNYGSPSKKGRVIWGELVPADRTWRTGANATTTIDFSKDVKIEGKPLAAGKYSIFSIHEDGKSTIIFNTDTGASEGRYDKAKDVLRVTVTPKEASEPSEEMEFLIDGDAVALYWGSRMVPFKVAAG